jgi:hypothetical protein
MKTLILIIGLLTLNNFGYSEETSAEIKDGSALIDAVRSVKEAADTVKKTGVIETTCISCVKDSPDKSYQLEKESFELDTPYYLKENKPYVIHLKRTKETPNKVRLTFKNGHRVCGKMTAYTLPMTGAFEVACMFYVTQFEEETFDLNFKSLPKLKDGETQILELKLSKENVEKSKYNVELNSLTGNPVIVEKDSKFWGDGFNFKLVELKN